jgi:hypothetical protein
MIGPCYGLDLNDLPKACMLKTCYPACGIIKMWWDFYDMGLMKGC